MVVAVIKTSLSSVMIRGKFKPNATIHAIPADPTTRDLVTMLICLNECLIAMYLSTFIRNKWRNVARPSIEITNRDCLFIRQKASRSSPWRVTIPCKMKRGIPIAPIITSVTAKQPRTMFETVWRRRFLLTESTTNKFRTVVRGQQTMTRAMINTTKAYAPECDLPTPPMVHLDAAVPSLEVAFEFIPSCFCLIWAKEYLSAVLYTKVVNTQSSPTLQTS